MNLYIFSICNYNNNNNRHSKMQWHRQEITQPHLDQDLHFNILPSLSLLQFSFSRFPFPLFLSLFVFLSLYDLYTLFIFVYGGIGSGGRSHISIYLSPERRNFSDATFASHILWQNQVLYLCN